MYIEDNFTNKKYTNCKEQILKAKAKAKES